MSWLLIIILIIASAFFVWQLVLFVRDIIRKVKAKKVKSQVDNPSAKSDSDRKE